MSGGAGRGFFHGQGRGGRGRGSGRMHSGQTTNANGNNGNSQSKVMKFVPHDPNDITFISYITIRDHIAVAVQANPAYKKGADIAKCLTEVTIISIDLDKPLRT